MENVLRLSGVVAEVKRRCPEATHFVLTSDRPNPNFGIYKSDATAASDLATRPGPTRMFKLDFFGTPHEIYRRDY